MFFSSCYSSYFDFFIQRPVTRQRQVLVVKETVPRVEQSNSKQSNSLRSIGQPHLHELLSNCARCTFKSAKRKQAQHISITPRQLGPKHSSVFTTSHSLLHYFPDRKSIYALIQVDLLRVSGLVISSPWSPLHFIGLICGVINRT